MYSRFQNAFLKWEIILHYWTFFHLFWYMWPVNKESEPPVISYEYDICRSHDPFWNFRGKFLALPTSAFRGKSHFFSMGLVGKCYSGDIWHHMKSICDITVIHCICWVFLLFSSFLVSALVVMWSASKD